MVASFVNGSAISPSTLSWMSAKDNADSLGRRDVSELRQNFGGRGSKARGCLYLNPHFQGGAIISVKGMVSSYSLLFY